MTGSGSGAKRILVLWWYPNPADLRPAIRQHLHALDASPCRHRIWYHNVNEPVPAWIRAYPFDVIVLHTTVLCLRWSPYFALLKWPLRWLSRSPALKIALPQDEYDHAHVLDEWLGELGVSLIGSNFDESYRALLYPRMRHRAGFLKCLTGYIDEATATGIAPRLKPAANRPLDLVYRAAHLPYWFGSQGQLKHDIADVVLQRAERLGLRCDISTRPQDTITSDYWFDFLASARGIIGCESGSTVIDRRGEMQARLRWLLLKEPGLTFADASRKMPAGWDDYRFFAIGPRHLEAVFTRTVQVLVEGEYDGILQANRHYIPLRRDLGNLDEALHQMRDHARLDAMTARAYEEVFLSGRWTYTGFARELDQAMATARQQVPTRSLPTRIVGSIAGTAAWTWGEGMAAWAVISRKVPELTRRCAGRGKRAVKSGINLFRKTFKGIVDPTERAVLGVIRRAKQAVARTKALWKKGVPRVKTTLRLAPWHAKQKVRRTVASLRYLVTAFSSVLLIGKLRGAWWAGSRVASSGRLARELATLGFMRRLQTGRTSDPIPFRLTLRSDGKHVQIISVPTDRPGHCQGRSGCNWADLESRLRSGRIASIRWDHSRIADEVRYARGVLGLGELYLPPGRVHEFEGLLALGRADPKRLVALLQFALGSEAEWSTKKLTRVA